MTLFHATTGCLLRIATAALRTHDMAQAQRVHDALRSGDVVIADLIRCQEPFNNRFLTPFLHPLLKRLDSARRLPTLLPLELADGRPVNLSCSSSFSDADLKVLGSPCSVCALAADCRPG
jgi:hypothetical protein